MNRFDPLRPRPDFGGDSPDILRLAQPMPLTAKICRLFHGGAWVSALVRSWRAEDVGRCRLCPRGQCIAGDDNSCLFMVTGYISDEEAPLYSTIGMVRQKSEGIG